MKRRKILFISFLAISLAFIAIGLLSGEFQVVRQKAVTVCLECIGIG